MTSLLRVTASAEAGTAASAAAPRIDATRRRRVREPTADVCDISADPPRGDRPEVATYSSGGERMTRGQRGNLRSSRTAGAARRRARSPATCGVPLSRLADQLDREPRGA